jgi:hypothetical protein
MLLLALLVYVISSCYQWLEGVVFVDGECRVSHVPRAESMAIFVFVHLIGSWESPPNISLKGY